SIDVQLFHFEIDHGKLGLNLWVQHDNFATADHTLICVSPLKHLRGCLRFLLVKLTEKIQVRLKFFMYRRQYPSPIFFLLLLCLLAVPPRGAQESDEDSE